MKTPYHILLPYDAVGVISRRNLKTLVVMLLCGLLSACAYLLPRPAGIGDVVAWSKLPGWELDRHAEIWPTLLRTCERLESRQDWSSICREAKLIVEPDDVTARTFFESRFEARVVHNAGNNTQGLITGYYEPILDGNLVKTQRFRYPIYKRPDNLLIIDLGDLYPELRGRLLRGRLEEENRVVPYYSREQITNGARMFSGQELVWVDDPVALFFLQIQGSGRVRLQDGRIMAVGYADQNGHPYLAIGRELVHRGALTLEAVSLQSIRAWLEAHPDEAEAVLNSNPSYIFFAERDPDLPGPLGALQVPLTAERSIAVDPAYIPLGSPVWLDTILPATDDGEEPIYRRLVLAQDTGGAIKGAVRADLFFGQGEEAEALSGRMKQPGRLYVMLPHPVSAASP